MSQRETSSYPDLFALHDLVEAQGAKKAVEAARAVTWTSEPGKAPQVQRALSGRNGRKIADTASNTIIREHERGHELGYTYSAWCLAGLPHREHPVGQNWRPPETVSLARLRFRVERGA